MNVGEQRVGIASGLSVAMVVLAVVGYWSGQERRARMAEAGAEEAAAIEAAIRRAAEDRQKKAWWDASDVPAEPASSHEATPEAEAPQPELGLRAGDEYQGVWHHRRDNFGLRLRVAEVDEEARTATVMLMCPDFGLVEKALAASRLASGDLRLTGIAGAGIDAPGNRRSPAYDLRDLLYAASTERIELKPSGDGLEGEAPSGAHFYFWARHSPE